MATYPFMHALITGASSGIGEAMARRLGAAGVPTVLVARRTERLDELAAQYPGFEVLTADLRDSDGVAEVERRIIDEASPIDLVVNNAGFGTSGLFHETDPDRLDDEIAVNVRALTRLSNAALRTMVPRGRGYLLNVSSVASFQPAPRLAVYAATKAFVTNLTESLHEEVRGTGVHVTALCPGLVKTEFQSVSRTESYETSYPSFAWLDVDGVAGDALDDVARGKALCVPGLLYKSMSFATGVTPRGVSRRLSGLVPRR